MTSDSRERMVRSAAALIASRGVAATSLTDVLTDSGAPRGSIYHHFPDGKQQLAADAMRWTSERVLAHQLAAELSTPAQVLDRFIGMWRQVVLTSDGASGCVVAGVALASPPGDDELIGIARETFQAWTTALTAQLESTGVPADRAASIAVAVLAGMEGALILCRAQGNVEPLDTVAAELKRLLPADSGG